MFLPGNERERCYGNKHKKILNKKEINIMKGLKLLTSLLAVGAVSTIFAAASFATDFTANASYTAGADGAAATVTITGLDNYTADNTVGDYTVVILNADVENPTNENIVYVMQGTKAEISTAKFANLAQDGSTYYVRVGGSSQGIAKATFTVGGGTTPEQKVLVGDVNGDAEITASDATEILCFTVSSESKIAEKPEKNDSFYAAAYCNGDITVTASDATEVLCKTVSLDCNPLVGTEVVKGSIGE